MREQVKTSDEDVKQVINAAFKRWLEESGNIHQLQHLKELEMQVDATENKENLSGSVFWPSTCSLKMHESLLASTSTPFLDPTPRGRQNNQQVIS